MTIHGRGMAVSPQVHETFLQTGDFLVKRAGIPPISRKGGCLAEERRIAASIVVTISYENNICLRFNYCNPLAMDIN